MCLSALCLSVQRGGIHTNELFTIEGEHRAVATHYLSIIRNPACLSARTGGSASVRISPPQS